MTTNNIKMVKKEFNPSFLEEMKEIEKEKSIKIENLDKLFCEDEDKDEEMIING